MAPAANQDHPQTAAYASTVPESATQNVDHTALVAGCYVAVVQVRGKAVPPRYRRRVYWNLPSAQRAVDRAAMEGLDASVVLVQLVPTTVAGGAHLG